jgi:hypothetical protein
VHPILVAGVGLILAVLGHLAALRMGLGAIAAYATSLLSGTMVTVVFALLTRGEDFAELLAGSLLLFGAWWFVFLNFVQSSQSSLRVNILRQAHLNGGTLGHAELAAQYNDKTLIELRLSRLVQSGAVAKVNDRYFVISSSARMLGRLFRGLKLLILGRPSEFHSSAGQGRNRSQEQ